MSSAANLDDDEDEDLCPLLESVGTPLASVTTVQVSRLTLDEEGREVRSMWLATLPSDSTMEDLAAAYGGGTYRIVGFNKGRFQKSPPKAVVEIEGKPRIRAGTAAPQAAVVEHASGLISIPGLSAEGNTIFTFMQQTVAQQREDARDYIRENREDARHTLEMLHRIVAEAVKRPEPASSEKFLVGQLDRYSKEAEAGRVGSKAGAAETLKLELKKLEIEKGEGGLSKLIEKLTDLLDPLANLGIGYMATKHGLAMPTTAGPAADAARGALEAAAEVLR